MIQIEFEAQWLICCEVCNNEIQGTCETDNEEIAKQRAEHEAKHDGWDYPDLETWYCPDCKE